MHLLMGRGGAKASLSTSRWSPTNRVSSMDPVGITNACTRKVVRNNSSRTVMVHSAMVPRGGSASGLEAIGGAEAGSVETGRAAGEAAKSVVFSGITAYILAVPRGRVLAWSDQLAFGQSLWD